jgi:CBS domain-containing protein
MDDDAPSGAAAGARRESLSLFAHRVRDFVIHPPVTCPPDLPARDVARRMLRERVSYQLVAAADGRPLGIITDRDLRRAVVAEGRDAATTPAADIMSTPLITVRASAFAFEAILEMTRRDVHHLVVTEEDRLLGVLSTDDVLALQRTHPLALARQIGRATSLDTLTEPAAQITALVRRLVQEGGAPYAIGQIVAELNDRIVLRVLGLVAGQLEEAGEAAPPLPYCWLALGSEARREQTLRTDQDNGLVYADPPAHLAERAAAYHARLADGVIRALVALGFPPCDGGFMASNAQWCQPLSVWEAYFHRWIHESTPDRLLAASIFFDLRPIAGAAALGARLREVIGTEVPRRPALLQLLARDVVDRRVPLTLFGSIAVRRRGPQRGTVDVKGAGVMQIVGAGRVDALELGADETNTVDRLRLAAARGRYGEAEVQEVTDAYQHLTRIRLVHQLAQLTRGERPDNAVRPDALTHADAVLFRDALRTVTRLQASLRQRYATDFVPA